MAMAMITTFEKVPNPGFSRNGIQARRTTALIANVDQPIVIRRFCETP
jgi:hypothetical protein